MKSIILFSSIFLLLSANSQTWRSVDIKALNPFAYVYGSAGTLNNHHFRINPYNNDIWLTYEDAVQVMDHNGQYAYYNTSNTAAFPSSNASFRDFAFTPQYTFAISGYHGLYQFDYSNWNLAVPFTDGINMCYDADTVWCIRTNQNYVKWFGGFNTTGNHPASRKAEIKKGLFWTSGENSGIVRRENGVSIYYSPDTTVLMDWGCWDMKFYPGTDSLFVANNAGLAIADGTTFIDSICATNCTNMPIGTILEFEFDANNNIWALIGNSGLYVKDALAHYNVATKVWDAYYDETNSPLLFNNTRMSIEVDNVGNLWLADNNYLWVLDEGNAPQWLATQENAVPLQLSSSPNPTSNSIQLNFIGERATIRISDAAGNTLSSFIANSNQQVSLDHLPAGVYVIHVTNEFGSGVERVVKE